MDTPSHLLPSWTVHEGLEHLRQSRDQLKEFNLTAREVIRQSREFIALADARICGPVIGGRP